MTTAEPGGVEPEATGIAREPDGAPRLGGLDILRGIAILGILFMNINDMSGSFYAASGDVRHFGWTVADRIAWWLREVLANGTARCMLELLFGCGMMILTDRAAETAGDWRVMGRYYLRNLILIVFGLVHVFVLLWPGDILHTYGLAALAAFLFRRLPWEGMLAIGLSLAVLQLVGGSIGLASARQELALARQLVAKVATGTRLSATEQATLREAGEQRASRAREKAEDATRVLDEDAARKGDARSWAKALIGVFLYLEKNALEPMWVWEAAATMLIGAALFRLGVMQGARSRRFYLAAMTIGYAVGVPVRVLGAYAITRFVDYPFPIYAWGEVGRLAMTIGHVGAIHALLATARGARLLRPFSAAGRTALSIYVAQTLICLWVLYPPFGLGLYGRMGWAALMLTALAVDAVLLAGASLYLRRCRIAPVEWAWRSLAAGRRLPLRRPG